jgi:hypothetical protein
MSYITVDCNNCNRNHEVWIDDIYDDFLFEVDKERLAKDLLEDGWIDENEIMPVSRNYRDVEFNKAVIKLSKNRVQLTKEEEELILKISSRF